MKAHTLYAALAALQAVRVHGSGKPLEFELWRQVMKAASSLESDLIVAGLEVPVQPEQEKQA